MNLVGISESTKVNATFTVIAALRQVAIVVAVLVHVAPGNLLAALPRVLAGPRLTPLRVLTGYADAFLAFSGLECITQFSPVMAEPRRRVTRLAMGALIATIALTSPLQYRLNKAGSRVAWANRLGGGWLVPGCRDRLDWEHAAWP